jgi:hypothetical protein
MDPKAYDLTLEQEFHMRLMTESTETMNKDQVLELLLQASKLLFVKENVLKSLMHQSLAI